MTKPKSKGKWTKGPTFWNYLTLVALAISIFWIGYQVKYQWPLNSEFARLRHDFPMTQDVYEATEIAKAIPLPESLETAKTLDYFPIVLLKTTQDAPAYFASAPYGYVLKLSTGLHTYLATDSPQISTEKRVVFSIGELRENRKKLTWIVYEGPFPPEGWTRFN